MALDAQVGARLRESLPRDVGVAAPGLYCWKVDALTTPPGCGARLSRDSWLRSGGTSRPAVRLAVPR